MKRIYLILLLPAIVSQQKVSAQKALIPEASTTQKIQQDFGLGNIAITYSRPNTKGRKMFGEIEPFNSVWRTGANAATIISFTDTVTMAGKLVPPGEYGLFSIPGKTAWTIILNKNARQWGAYKYDSTQDLFRFKVKPSANTKAVETFTIQFDNVTAEHAELHLLWEKTDVAVPLQTDVDAKVVANIEQAVTGENKTTYQAKGAIYFYTHNKDNNKALAWITEADKGIPDAYYMKYWKAKIQLRAGDKAGAVATAKEGLRMAEKEPSTEYIRMNKEVLAEAGKK